MVQKPTVTNTSTCHLTQRLMGALARAHTHTHTPNVCVCVCSTIHVKSTDRFVWSFVHTSAKCMQIRRDMCVRVPVYQVMCFNYFYLIFFYFR